MRRILLSTLLAVCFVTLAKAQEAKGETADKVGKEILKMEHEKLLAFRSTASSHNYCAEWIDRVDADDIDHTDADGTVDTKAQLLDQLRSGQLKAVSIQYHDDHIRVYGKGHDGTTAVDTYFIDVINEKNGSNIEHHYRVTDVWVKLNGHWRFVVHSAHPLPPDKSNRSAW